MPHAGDVTIGGVCLSAYVYEGNPQDEPFKDKRLNLASDGTYFVVTVGQFASHPTEDVSRVQNPTGWWDCVISLATPQILHVRRSSQDGAVSRLKNKPKYTPNSTDTPEQAAGKLAALASKRQALAVRGHSSIAQGGVPHMPGHLQPFALGRGVLFAGRVCFGGDSVFSPGDPPGSLIQWTNESGHYKIGRNPRPAASASPSTSTTAPKAAAAKPAPMSLNDIMALAQQRMKASAANEDEAVRAHVRQQTSTLPDHFGQPLLPMEKFVRWSGEK